MNQSRGSVAIAGSLKPEYEFQVIKLVLLRENYLKQLENTLKSSKNKLTLKIVGLCDVLRNISAETVEAIDLWGKAQVHSIIKLIFFSCQSVCWTWFLQITYPKVVAFTWNDEDYLRKMVRDQQFLRDIPMMRDWLGNTAIENPFFVPSEVLEQAPNLFLHQKIMTADIILFIRRCHFVCTQIRMWYLVISPRSPPLQMMSCEWRKRRPSLPSRCPRTILRW